MRIAVFGNPTIDELFRGRRMLIAPGGSGFYVSATLASFGAKVDLVGNVGYDYPTRFLKWLRGHHVETKSLRHTAEATTSFRLKYHGSHRSLKLLRPGSLVGVVPSRRWDAVHVGPVFREIGDSLVLKLRRRSRFVSLDVQGFLRESTDRGIIRLRRRSLGKVLSSCDAVKASFEEGKVQTGLANPLAIAHSLLSFGPANVIVTRAGKGTILAVKRGGVFEIPAYPEKHVVDPTGAGDGFVGAWLATVMATKDPVWAASVGSGFASMMIRYAGVRKFRFSKAELAGRSWWIFRNVKRLS